MDNHALRREYSQRRRSPLRSASVAANSPPAPPAAEIVDEEVVAWSRQLFPEAVAAAGGRQRIVHCND